MTIQKFLEDLKRGFIKKIDGFDGYYVSKDGHVFSNKMGEIKRLNAYTSGYGGYRRVALRKNSKSYNKKIAILVMEAFSSLRPKGLVLSHNDGNKNNDHLDNLEWVTSKRNSEIMVEQGRSLKGEKQTSSKLKEKDVLKIIRLLNEGMTLQKIGKMFGVTHENIFLIKKGKTWKHIPRCAQIIGEEVKE